MKKTKYPIFIMSYHRADNCLTATALEKAGLDFRIVVEALDYPAYAKNYPDKLIKCPDGVGIYGVCNFIKDHAAKAGHKFHWQMDDDIRNIFQWEAGKASNMSIHEILTTCEKFVDQYENIGIAGLSSNAFSRLSTKPYVVNSYPHTCVLVRSHLNIRYRADVESDVDFIIRLLQYGYCSIRFNMFAFVWMPTEAMAGGATKQYSGGGRLKRFQNTLKMWPQIGAIVPKVGGCGWRLTTEKIWRKFKHPLIRDPKVKEFKLPNFIIYKPKSK